MDSAMDHARGHMPDDIQTEIADMLKNREEYWVPNKIVELRGAPFRDVAVRRRNQQGRGASRHRHGEVLPEQNRGPGVCRDDP